MALKLSKNLEFGPEQIRYLRILEDAADEGNRLDPEYLLGILNDFRKTFMGAYGDPKIMNRMSNYIIDTMLNINRILVSQEAAKNDIRNIRNSLKSLNY